MCSPAGLAMLIIAGSDSPCPLGVDGWLALVCECVESSGRLTTRVFDTSVGMFCIPSGAQDSRPKMCQASSIDLPSANRMHRVHSFLVFPSNLIPYFPASPFPYHSSGMSIPTLLAVSLTRSSSSMSAPGLYRASSTPYTR